MPMDFPDMDSLKSAAEVHEFRQPNEGESEQEYRNALADHIEPRDFIESCEIRAKVGWDKFRESDNLGMLMRSAFRNRH